MAAAAAVAVHSNARWQIGLMRFIGTSESYVTSVWLFARRSRRVRSDNGRQRANSTYRVLGFRVMLIWHGLDQSQLHFV